MKLHRIHHTHLLPISKEEAWDFFSDPGNLQAITPEWMGFQITSELPDQAYAGLIITYRLRVLPGITVRWVTEITHLEPGRLFVDEQRSGPYRFWHHQHLFKEIEGGTVIEDIIHYAMPVGILGEVVHRFLVRQRLDEIFQFRAQILSQRFGAAAMSDGKGHPGR